MAPTSEEELKLRLFSGSISQLCPADRFLKALVEIPFAIKRMETLLYMSTLQEELTSTRDSFSILEVGSLNSIPNILHCLYDDDHDFHAPILHVETCMVSSICLLLYTNTTSTRIVTFNHHHVYMSVSVFMHGICVCVSFFFFYQNGNQI